MRLSGRLSLACVVALVRIRDLAVFLVSGWQGAGMDALLDFPVHEGTPNLARNKVNIPQFMGSV